MADHLQRIKLFGTVRLATSYFGGRRVFVAWVWNKTRRAFISEKKIKQINTKTNELIWT